MISEKVRKAFKAEAEKYLGSQSLGALRNYGRDIGVYAPTKQNKGGLIEQIVEILAGEREPVPQSKRGAPVLDDRVDPRIVQEMNRLSLLHFSGSSEEESTGTPKEEPKVEYFNEEHYKAFRKAYKEMQEHKVMLRVSAPSAEDCEDEVRVGQLRTLDSVPRLLPLDCPEFGEQIAVSNDFVRHYDLQEGDVISCHARKSNNIYVATTILEVNGTKAEDFYRNRFDACDVCYPYKRIKTYDGGKFTSVTNKFFEWLCPIGKGQRGLVLAAPKAGKTYLLQQLSEAISYLNEEVTVIALLVDQSPEAVGAFRKLLPRENILYTTYEESSNRQLFVAEFALQRAKAFAECGKDVVLLVDSFNALARAYNETDDSAGGKTLACGLESTTVHYIKKYFGTARCLEKSGSLTIIGGVATGTGNPADDVIASELAPLANLEIRLNHELAYRRIFPALDLSQIRMSQNEQLQGLDGERLIGLLRNEILPKRGVEYVQETLAAADSYAAFITAVKRDLNEKR